MKQLVQFSLLFLFLFAACKTEQDVPAPASADDMLSYIKQLGFRPNEIEDKGDYYLVDGDISFPKNIKIETNCESHLFPDALETRQYGSQSYIGFNAQPNITIRIDPSMAVHTATIQQAVAAWNDIPNCRAKFNFTTASNENVLIRASRDGDNIDAFTCGRAFPPLNGRASGELLINRNLGVMEFNTPQLRGTIIHELGHILGLRHTNWIPAGEVKDAVRLSPTINNPVTATNILGTPTGNDPLSMMNGSTCGISPATLSANDIIAIQTIYPATAPRAGTVPVFRYFHVGNGDHFFTTNFNELGGGTVNATGNNGFRFEGIGFFAFPSQVANTIPVFRYFHTGAKRHFYTTNFNELRNGGNGWILESRAAFFVHPNQINGSVPVLRFFNGAGHFYTKNANEFVTGNMGYNPEGTAFFAF